MNDSQWILEPKPGWKVLRLKHVCRFVGGGTPDTGNPEYWQGGIPWVSPKDMKSSSILDAEDHISEAGLNASAARLVQAGAVLIVMRSGILRHSIPVAVNEVPVALNQDMKALLTDSRLRPGYLARLIEGHQAILLRAWRKEGATVESLEFDLLSNTLIPVPSPEVQRTIADYLDRETARIDALIAAKERLLGLLAEKRQALITRAVTRGLNPNAPLRDSNIPWLGPIPAHWELSRLKFIAQVTVGIVVTPAKYYQDGGVPCLRSLNVKPNRLSGEDLVFISEDSNEFHAKSRLRVGDVVVVRTGVPGTAAVVDQRFDGANCIDLILIRPSPNIEPSFLSYFLNSEAAKRQFLSGSDGAAQQHFNVETATNLQVILPPIDEQSQIIADMGERLAALEKVASSATHTITLLKERRSALIAAAVTGQIPIPEPDPIP